MHVFSTSQRERNIFRSKHSCVGTSLIRNTRVCKTRKNASKINKLTIVVGWHIKPARLLKYVYKNMFNATITKISSWNGKQYLHVVVDNNKFKERKLAVKLNKQKSNMKTFSLLLQLHGNAVCWCLVLGECTNQKYLSEGVFFLMNCFLGNLHVHFYFNSDFKLVYVIFSCKIRNFKNEVINLKMPGAKMTGLFYL